MLLRYRINLNFKYFLMESHIRKVVNSKNLVHIKYKNLKTFYQKYHKSFVDDYVFNCFVRYFNTNREYNTNQLEEISKIIKELKIDLDYYSQDSIMKLYESQFSKIRPLKTQSAPFQKFKMEKIYFQFLKSRLNIITDQHKLKFWINKPWFGNIYITNKRIIFVNDGVEKSIFLINKNHIKIKKHKVIIEGQYPVKDRYILLVHNYEALIIALKRVYKL